MLKVSLKITKRKRFLKGLDFMQQVPRKYGIVGDGLAAKHILRYFKLLGVDVAQYKRTQQQGLVATLSECTHVLLLISDDAIGGFFKENASFLEKKTLVHFSGALHLEAVYGLHPMCTFGPKVYKREFYERVVFVGEAGRPGLYELIPEFKKNPYYAIPVDLKPLYHALCVMGGNFTTLLWQKVINDFERLFKIPKTALEPYIEKIFSSIKQAERTVPLTGPLARGDKQTVQKHLSALDADPFKDVYAAIVSTYQ